MQGPGKQLQEVVSELNEKVKQHQGEVAFCLREFNVPGETTGDFVPPIPYDYHYYDTGIILGEIQKNEHPETRKIHLPSLDIMAGDKSDEEISGYYSVPVGRNLNGFVNHFDFRSGITLEQLERLNQGNLLIDLKDFEDFALYSFLLSRQDRTSHRTRTDILIGDEEVEKFLKEKKFRNYQELFDVLKNPLTVEGRISEHYSQEAKKLGEEIVITANFIKNTFRKVEALEERVMHAHYISGASSDERTWDKEEEVDAYHGLKRVISGNIEILNGQLLRGENPKLFKTMNFSFLDGDIIGLYSRVLVSDQFNYIKRILMPDIEKTFTKIDSYLSEQRKKTSH